MAAKPTSGRADARRNADALLVAAKAVFADVGVDAPAKVITDRAGVGVGTLYRHYPLRSDLIVAVLEDELADCVAAAESLHDTDDAWSALLDWVGQYTAFVATKHGLATALHSGDPAYVGLLDRLLADLVQAFAGLLARAVEQGRARADVSAREVLLAVALLCQPVRDDGPASIRLRARVFVDGLRS